MKSKYLKTLIEIKNQIIKASKEAELIISTKIHTNQDIILKVKDLLLNKIWKVALMKI